MSGSGNKCEYINCERTRRQIMGLKLFRFPIKDLVQTKKWIVNSGNVNLLDLSYEELHKRLVCEYHFTEEDYINSLLRNRLKLSAVPQPHNGNKSWDTDGLEVIFEISGAPSQTFPRSLAGKKRNSIDEDRASNASSNVSSTSHWLETIMDMPSSPNKQLMSNTMPTGSSENCSQSVNEAQKVVIQNLKKKIMHKNKRIATQASLICKMRNRLKLFTAKIKQMTAEIKLHNSDFIMKWSKTLVDMQMKKKHRKWKNDEKCFALSFYYKFPDAYKYLRRCIVLPSESVIRKWINKSMCLPGTEV